MPSAATHLLRIVTGSWLNLLLLAAPLSFWLRWQFGVSIWVFVTSAISLVAIGIVAVSLVPVVVEWLRHRKKGQPN